MRFQTHKCSARPRIASGVFAPDEFSVAYSVLQKINDTANGFSLKYKRFLGQGGQSPLVVCRYVSGEESYDVVVKASPSDVELAFARDYDPLQFPFVIPMLPFKGVFCGEPRDQLMMMFASCDGETLVGKLQALFKSNVTDQQTARLAVYFVAFSLLYAIDDLADATIVHRDLRIPNILLLSSGYVCLSDFGLAKLRDLYPLGVSQPESVAPEEFVRQATPKSDIWALGSLFLKLILNVYPLDLRKSQQFNNPVGRLLSVRKCARGLFSDPSACVSPISEQGSAEKEDKFDPSKNPDQLRDIYALADVLKMTRFASFAIKLMKTNPADRPDSKEALILFTAFMNEEFGSELPVETMQAAVKTVLSTSDSISEEEDEDYGTDVSLLDVFEAFPY